VKQSTSDKMWQNISNEVIQILKRKCHLFFDFTAPVWKQATYVSVPDN